MEHLKSILFAAKTIIFIDCKNCIEKPDLLKRSSGSKLLLEQKRLYLKHIVRRKNTLADLNLD